MIDFTNCEIDLSSNYGGSDQKRGIIYNGKRYMVKISDRIETAGRNNLRDSYSNSVFSEYICCHILQSMGLDTQNTLLGTIIMDTKRHKDKVVNVVACENFVPDGYNLVEFKNIQNSLAFTKPEKTPKESEIMEIFSEDNRYLRGKFRQKAKERYWDTFICDALLGNFDRHANNWGYLVANDNSDIKLAPIYDCGSCLYPQLRDEVLEEMLKNKDEINKRIKIFPNAALKLADGSKANYAGYIGSLRNNDCTEALLRVIPKINLDEIARIIDTTEGISEIRKAFYQTMIEERYEQIIVPAYEIALERGRYVRDYDPEDELDREDLDFDMGDD